MSFVKSVAVEFNSESTLDISPAKKAENIRPISPGGRILLIIMGRA